MSIAKTIGTAAGVLGMVAATAASGAPKVAIETGSLMGASDEGAERFLGIPYAAPPVGDLRWRAPRPATAWKGVRPAVSYGADCMQNPLPTMPWAPQPVSEDCLYLNIWRPAEPSAKPLPVMVSIHGGGFAVGSGAWPLFEGSGLAKRGVVLVTINYRLNRFGFFTHPALAAQAAEEPLYNYGLMDQVAALEWVQRNIAAFGGDPKNVTIFGESAGGMSVNHLLSMPAALGLFAKAIVQSGGGSGMLKATNTLDKAGASMMGPQPSALETGKAFIASLGVTDPTPEALRALPAAAILGNATMSDGSGASPVVDGKLVVEDPVTAFAAGRQAVVPYLVGANTLEASILPPGAVQAIWTKSGPLHGRIEQLYDGYGTGDPDLRAAEFVGDLFMGEGARNLARRMSATGAPTYRYVFDHIVEPLRAKVPGTPHGGELGFVFGTYRTTKQPEMPGDSALSNVTMSYWTNFAKTGNPNGPGLPNWPRFSADTDEILLFTNDGPVTRTNYHRDRFDFVSSLAAP